MSPILLISFLYLLITIIISLLFTRKKWEFIFYIFSFGLILTPSTKILGLYSSSVLNFNINQYIIYILIFLYPISFLFLLKGKKNSNTLLKYYYKKIGVFFFLIICSFLFNMILNVMYYRVSFFALPRYHLMEYLSAFVILHFSLILFSKIDSHRISIVFRNLWIITLIYSATLGAIFFLKIPFAESFQKIAYNFNFKGTTSFLDTALDASIYLNRSYSIFGGGNQFGILASISLIIASYLLNEKIITKTLFFILIFFQLLILTSSLSRTGFLFYLLTWLILVIRNSGNIFKTSLFLIGFSFILYLALTIFDERIQNIFILENFISAFFSERLNYWILFFEILKSTPESLYLGLSKYYFLSRNIFFENGYLNLYAEGGLFTLLLHFLAYFVLMFQLKKTTGDNKFSSFHKSASDYLLLFLLIELLQGALLSFRFEAINGITIGYFIYLKYLNYKSGLQISSADQNYSK